MKMKYRLILAIALQTVVVVLSAFKSSYYKVIHGTSSTGVAYYTVPHEVESNFYCARMCNFQDGCNVASYTSSTKTCAFHDWLRLSLQRADENQSIIMETTVEMFHVHNPDTGVVMGYTEALALCSSFGNSLLASTDNIYDANDAGYHRCTCGWISDESIRFAVQNMTASCYAYTSGVNSCKTIMTSSADVYCNVQ